MASYAVENGGFWKSAQDLLWVTSLFRLFLTFSSTVAMLTRYMAIFKISHFTISYFRILPTQILVCHMTSKAASTSRPIRITKHRRRATNRSRDMLDFRFLAFCQRWPLWIIQSQRSSYHVIGLDLLSNIVYKHHVAPTYRFWDTAV